MADLKELRQNLAAALKDLADIDEMVALDESDEDLLALQQQARDQVADWKSQIAALEASQNSAPPHPPPDTPAKYDMSKHPKFRAENADTPPPPPEEPRVVFSVGDSVMAKYSADKQWYAASIISKTGSPTDPHYTVKFSGYGDIESKRKFEVRAVESKKRKADGTPAAALSAIAPPPPSPKPVQSGTVISAAPSVDPTLVQKREPSKVSDGPTRMAPAPKKLKGNKILEKSKSSWNDWQKTGPKKPVIGGGKLGKDSQFRTPDLPNAKGSGKPMSKDQVRTKWQYGHDDAAD